jgi:hypothetical protein
MTLTEALTLLFAIPSGFAAQELERDTLFVRQYLDLRVRLGATGCSGAPQRGFSPRPAEHERPAGVVILPMLARIMDGDFEHVFSGAETQTTLLYLSIGK